MILSTIMQYSAFSSVVNLGQAKFIRRIRHVEISIHLFNHSAFPLQLSVPCNLNAPSQIYSCRLQDYTKCTECEEVAATRKGIDEH